MNIVIKYLIHTIHANLSETLELLRKSTTFGETEPSAATIMMNASDERRLEVEASKNVAVEKPDTSNSQVLVIVPPYASHYARPIG